jgi:hypothetical protein
MEDVEGEGEVAGNPQHFALPVQIALSVPYGGHNEPIGGYAPKRLSNYVGRVVAVGDCHQPVGRDPGKVGGSTENHGGSSVFFNCLEQLRHRGHDVSRKEEREAHGEDGPVVDEVQRSRPSWSE